MNELLILFNFMKSITFDKSLLKKLQSRFDLAIKNGEEIFIFEGKEMLTTFAKYLIEYLNEQFKN